MSSADSTVHDGLYVFACVLAVWNTERYYTVWDPQKEAIPMALFTAVLLQLFGSLVFVLGQIILTGFISQIQAFVWLSFVVFEGLYVWRAYQRMHPMSPQAPVA